MKVTVIGAGAWGTTIAIHLAHKAIDVTLWAYETDLVGRMQRERVNEVYLPGFRFPDALANQGLKIPHTGWNQIEPAQETPLLRGLPERPWAYFNHAYYCEARPEDVLATTDYGGPFPSIVSRGSIYGIQFHPEKSQDVGLHILSNFVEHVT